MTAKAYDILLIQSKHKRIVMYLLIFSFFPLRRYLLSYNGKLHVRSWQEEEEEESGSDKKNNIFDPITPLWTKDSYRI